MFSIQIKDTLVVFSKFFSASDREAVLEVIKKAGCVVFIDTPATVELVDTIRKLKKDGIAVIMRDHHDVCGEPQNDRETAIRQAVEQIRELVGDEMAVISNRQANPACSSLISVGEFGPVPCPYCNSTSAEDVGIADCPTCGGTNRMATTVIVTDPDADGLTAAMKACGVVYPELDSDAGVLDGPRVEQTAERLSPTAMLLVKGMATLPPFNPKNPAPAEEAKSKLFAEFVAMVSGDTNAKASLEAKVEVFEAAVAEAEKLAAEATEPAPCVWLVDVVGKPRFNLQTLTERLEARPGCRITVIRKDNGPIAAKHGGVQYSLAVPRPLQQEVNLVRATSPSVLYKRAILFCPLLCDRQKEIYLLMFCLGRAMRGGGYPLPVPRASQVR